MMLIPCPLCGPRNEREFSYSGATRNLPALDGKTTAKDWHQALHLRTNPRGLVEELWYHASGCESWLAVTRNTATHEISAVRLGGKTAGSL